MSADERPTDGPDSERWVVIERFEPYPYWGLCSESLYRSRAEAERVWEIGKRRRDNRTLIAVRLDMEAIR